MKVQVFDTREKEWLPAAVLEAEAGDLPLKKNGWQFNWRQLFRTTEASFFRLALEKDGTLQGMLMLSLLFEEMLYMDNLEVAPHNLGRKGRFGHVAGSLIAFACRQSFLFGKGAYQGYLTFTSKSELVPLYQERYGASLAMGQKMFIGPDQGKLLMKQYLTIKESDI